MGPHRRLLPFVAPYGGDCEGARVAFDVRDVGSGPIWRRRRVRRFVVAVWRGDCSSAS